MSIFLSLKVADERDLLCIKEEMFIGMVIGSAFNDAGISSMPDRLEMHSVLRNVLLKVSSFRRSTRGDGEVIAITSPFRNVGNFMFFFLVIEVCLSKNYLSG